MPFWTPLPAGKRLPLPDSIKPTERSDWVDFAQRLVQLQRHEDTLLNTRLQGFMVATAFLMAALSQFREAKFLPIAILICVFGVLLSASAFHILQRTAQTIEWYNDALVRFDTILYADRRQRLYASRRELLGELDTGSKPSQYPVTALIGAWLPLSLTVVWVAIAALVVYIHR